MKGQITTSLKKSSQGGQQPCGGCYIHPRDSSQKAGPQGTGRCIAVNNQAPSGMSVSLLKPSPSHWLRISSWFFFVQILTFKWKPYAHCLPSQTKDNQHWSGWLWSRLSVPEAHRQGHLPSSFQAPLGAPGFARQIIPWRWAHGCIYNYVHVSAAQLCPCIYCSTVAAGRISTRFSLQTTYKWAIPQKVWASEDNMGELSFWTG